MSNESVEFNTDFNGNIVGVIVSSEVTDDFYAQPISVELPDPAYIPEIDIGEDNREVIVIPDNIPDEDKVVFINDIEDAPSKVITYILGGIRSVVGEKAWIFNTTEEMRQWLNIQSNVNKLTAGDDIRIKEAGASDYWWDGTALHITAASGLTIEEVARVYKDSVDNVFGDIIYVND